MDRARVFTTRGKPYSIASGPRMQSESMTREALLKRYESDVSIHEMRHVTRRSRGRELALAGLCTSSGLVQEQV